MGSDDTKEKLKAAGFRFYDYDKFDLSDELPAHRVRITKPFLLGQTEVTQGQFERVMGKKPHPEGRLIREGPGVAASCVPWDDAVEFCRKLTELERRAGRLAAGGSYRLPTEAEWEYACRAGTQTRFPFGDDESLFGDYAWSGGYVSKEKYAHDVGMKQPNRWGLHDMHGNVWEWCSDWYDKAYYARSPVADPQGPPAAGSSRVVRGGSWWDDPIVCRSASRSGGTLALRDNRQGFRVVREVE